jgi:O-antigen ligase
MPYLSALTGVDFLVGGLSVRLDHLVGIILFVFLFISILKVKKIYLIKNDLFLIALWLLSLVVSYYNAPDTKYSLIQSINLITVGLSYFVITNQIKTKKHLDLFISAGFNTALFVSFFGTILFIVSFIIKKPLYGVNIEQSINIPFGIYFTIKEPNLYGSFMFVHFFLSVIMLFEKTNQSFGISDKKIKAIVFFTAIGVLLSFTRGIWLATIVCLFLYYIKSIKRVLNNFYKIFIIVLTLVVFYTVTLNYFGITFLKYKIDNFFSIEEGTGEGRVFIWLTALDNWAEKKNFLFGNGTYSFASFYNKGSYESDTNAWIGNFLVTLLHDYGIIGLVLFFCFLVGLLRTKKIKKLLMHNAKLKHYKALIISFRLAILGVLIGFFFTMAFSLTYVWMLFGLMVATKKIILKETYTINV